MADLRFEIDGKQGEISASAFKEAIGLSVGLLQEFDSAISGLPRGSLRWYIGGLHSNGNLSVSFQSKLKRFRRKKLQPTDFSPAITSSFLNGFELLENRCETPAYLSEFGLRKAEGLAELIGRDGPTGFRFASNNQVVEVTTKTSENISKLLPIKRKAVGSVEGKLEGINLHNKPRVIVYRAINKKAVTCEFDPEQFMEQVKEYLGKRVVVFGTLHKNMNGDTLRVTMDRLQLATETRHASLDAKEWADPEFTTAASTADYIRRIRGG